MLNDLEDMAIFARVVEAKSFTAAAAQTGLSASALSKHVSQLETRLHVRLLNRTTRQLSLTEAGGVFFAHCARMLAEARAAEQAIMQLQAGPRGTVKLVAPLAFGALQIAPALSELLRQHLELRVNLVLEDQPSEALNGSADILIRLGRLTDSSLQARRLAACRNIVCAAPAYLQRYGIPTTLAELGGHVCLMARDDTTMEWRFQASNDSDPSGTHSVRVNGPLVTNNLLAQRAVAVAGGGIALLPAYVVSADLHSGLLRSLLPDYTVEPVPVHALYPQNRRVLPKVRVVIDFLLACYARADWNFARKPPDI